MDVTYRKALEKVARQMILIHRADVLIKLILRTIYRKVGVRHAGIFVYDAAHDAFVVQISRGDSGFRIPSGFARLKKDNPIIRYFTARPFPFCGDYILADQLARTAATRRVRKNAEAAAFLQELTANLDFYRAHACIPGFFRRELTGILFLGEKNDGSRFSAGELGFLSVLASDVVMALKNAWLIEDLNRQLEVNRRLFFQMVSALLSSIEAKDRYTKGHTERVMRYALTIAEQLKKHGKLSGKAGFLENLRIAALLHDIGKIGIPEDILNKPAALSESERAVINRHPLIGEDILKNVDELGEVILGVKYHHERCDGHGYPYGLKGEEIPLIAAVICLADAYDAMTTDRPYRRALTKDEAFKEITTNRGRHFVPLVVDAFEQLIEEGQGL